MLQSKPTTEALALEIRLTQSMRLRSLSLLGPGLLVTEHAQHRKQRKMLTPVFSAAYLRGITSVFYETTYKVRGRRVAREAPTNRDHLTTAS